MQYIVVTPHQIEDLRAAMDLFEQLWEEDVDERALFLYGLVQNDPSLITPMEEAVRDEADLHETVKIDTAAVIIPLSSDILYYLTGSGLVLRKEDFAYISNKEIRSSNFSWGSQEPRATLTSFVKIALAANDYHAEDFLKWEGVQAMDVVEPPSRTEEATEEDKGQEGGLVEEGGTVAKSSSYRTPDIWTTANLDDLSVNELFSIRAKLIEKRATGYDSEFVWYKASNSSGFLIKTDIPQEAFNYISDALNLDVDDIEEESTVMTGRELVEDIDNLLSGE